MKLNNILCSFSGDDYHIVRQCSRKLRQRFLSIGALVALVFVLCVLSSCYTFVTLFDSPVIGVFTGLIFSCMVTIIYVLILYTLTKNIFPHKTKKVWENISLTIRILFVCFISIIISKPLECLVFSNVFKAEVRNYKIQQLDKYIVSTNSYFEAELKEIRSLLDKQKNLTGLDSLQTKSYAALLGKKKAEKVRLVNKMKILISKSNYFIRGMIGLNTRHGYCWMITILMIFIFLLPPYLKVFLSEHTDYYDKKKKIENRLVLEEYEVFKQRYALLLKLQFRKSLVFSEPFADPPFNTKPKNEATIFLKESDLLTDLYHG